ncbi:MAG: phosphotransferase [Acidobacteriota bacterium]
MSAADTQPVVPESLRRRLDEAGYRPDSLTRLTGDASTRRYGRLERRDGGTVLLMENAELPPFVAWRDFLAELDLRVPAILLAEPSERWAVLEDLGDLDLQQLLERDGIDAGRPAYALAVDWVRRLAEDGTQRWTIPDDDGDDPLTGPRLAWEMDFFLRHALGRSEDDGLPPLDGDGAIATARRLLHDLCERLHRDEQGEPRPMVLCHRDYHARNLMIPPGEPLAVIDFQDTRRGPRSYDLVSLVFDPYVELPDDLVEELLERGRPADTDATSWRRELALVAGQRLIKAAGSYAYLAGCGRDRYLRWYAPALERARTHLEPVLAETEILFNALASASILDGPRSAQSSG